VAAHTPINEISRNGEMIPPVVRGLGITAIPRPQRYYFKYGPRIRTDMLRGQEDRNDVVLELRRKVARSIQGSIRSLKKHRTSDRSNNWSPLRRWLAPLDR
jgi:hypothetical protein